jgi:hypothetical protein
MFVQMFSSSNNNGSSLSLSCRGVRGVREIIFVTF